MNINSGKTIILVVAGIVVILIGLSLLLGNVFGLGLFFYWRSFVAIFSIFSALIIIALGVILIVRAQQKAKDSVVEKRLFRSTSKKAIGGVCGGIADYFNLDPVIIRVIAIILGFTSAYIVVPLYLILWIIVPPDTRNSNTWV